MHKHFADMFNAIEMGVRFEERSRMMIDGGGSSPAKPKPQVGPTQQDYIDAQAAKAAKLTAEAAALHGPQKTDATDAGKGAKETSKDGAATKIGKNVDKTLAGVTELAKPALKTVAETAKTVGDNHKKIVKSLDGLGDAIKADKPGAKALAEAAHEFHEDGNATNAGKVIDAFTAYAGDATGRVVSAAGNVAGKTAQAVIDDAKAITKVALTPYTIAAAGLEKGIVNVVVDQTKTFSADIDAVKKAYGDAKKSRDEFLDSAAKKFSDVGKSAAERNKSVADGGAGTKSGAFIDNATGYVGAGFSVGVDYVTRDFKAGVDQASALAKTAGDAATAPIRAVSSFLGGVFGGKSKDGDDKEADPAGNSEGSAHTPVSADTADRLDAQGALGAASGSHSPVSADTADRLAAQQAAQIAAASHAPMSADTADRLAAQQAAQNAAASHAPMSADTADRLAAQQAAQEADGSSSTPSNGSDGEVTPPPSSDTSDQTNDVTPTPIDYTSTDNRATVIKAATDAKLISADTHFDANGTAHHTVERGDGYWNIVAKYSGPSGDVDTQLWVDTQKANHAVPPSMLYTGNDIVIPGRSIDDLVQLLGMPTTTN